jgi:gliding motility-associated-like protein
VEDPCGIDKFEFANALTPNGDGFNDYFEIRNSGDAQINQVLIYTRWGEKIFESASINERWDGTIGGAKLAQPGVYLYLVRGICKNGQDEFNLTGNITLLK